jgi:signal peptidase
VARDDVSAERQSGRSSRLASWAVNALLAFAILLVVMIVVPALFGYHRYVINGKSMETAIPYGSVVYDDEVPVGDLVVGDVITFVPPPEYAVTDPVTHRIISIEDGPDGQRVFRTKGDNNEGPDPWEFTLDQPTQARVAFHVPYVGFFYIALSVWWVRLLAIVLPALAVAVWLGVSLWRDAGREVEAEKRRRLSPRSVP